mmetsp:Transcript_51892/g.137055  ORF Transcript_51892/g.137055 Transcript_51892/m.137055 type:complete len:122 (+) Transcript_51892:88-453(+)
MGCGASGAKKANSKAKLSAATTTKIEELFDKMDENKDGCLTKDEAQRFFKNFAKVSSKAMFNEVDTDCNGDITRVEFVGFWEQVIKNGYTDDTICEEVEMMATGSAWVDWKDNRQTGGDKD